jgi:preprotein translocase subunit SecE
VKKMNSMVKYFNDSYKELINKVSWPTWTQLEMTAVSVILSTIVLSLLLFGMDWLLLYVLDFIY